MLINEIAERVGMTKRAIKYYEEKNLLSVKKRREWLSQLYRGRRQNIKEYIGLSEIGNRHLGYSKTFRDE